MDKSRAISLEVRTETGPMFRVYKRMTLVNVNYKRNCSMKLFKFSLIEMYGIRMFDGNTK